MVCVSKTQLPRNALSAWATAAANRVSEKAGVPWGMFCIKGFHHEKWWIRMRYSLYIYSIYIYSIYIYVCVAIDRDIDIDIVEISHQSSALWI